MTVYSDSPYGCTFSVSGTKQAMTSEWLQQCAAFTNGGTIPFWIRYQYKVNFIITGGTKDNPTYGGWGPLDETVDKINAIPGLRILLPIQQFPQFMLSIDGTGKFVGYGNGAAVLPKWDIYATVAEVIAQRYGNRMHMWQIGNEEYDIQAHNGAVLAPVFNAAYPAIKRHSSSPVIMGAVRKLPPGGSHVSTWMNNFVNYVPNISAGESPQAIPDGADFHYYRDGSIITLTSNPAPDPATTDNSSNPGIASIPSVGGEYSIIRPILDTLSPGIPIGNLEFGWDNSNNAAINSSYPGTTPPWYVSRYTLTQFALSHFAGLWKNQQFTIGQYTDAKSLHRQGLIDMANYIAANPQYTPGAAPTAYLYQTIDRLDYEGTVGTAPPDQYFAITNPTGSNKAWSVTSNQSWLTVAGLPLNGIKGTQWAGLTSGTLTVNPLTPNQQITLKAMVDSTQAGLSTLTTLTATLTVTVGANVSTIAVNLWVNPNDAVPHITVDQNSALQPTATVNGSNPASQVVHITNAGNYKHNWYGYTQAKWLDISLSNGTLNAGATQAVTITYDITGLAPGNYLESAYFCLTPFPPQYKNNAVPANPQYVNVLVNLKVTASNTPQVQLSTGAMYFTAGVSGSLPASQTFFINNCTKSAQNWTVAAGSYTGGGTGWLTLTPGSGNNLPASGSQTGTSPNVQSTDYTLVTASINTTALAAGIHTATVTCTLGVTATATITVTYEVTSSSPTEIIGASPTTVTAPSQIQGGTPVTATTTLTNSGNTTGTYTTTKTAGTSWLSISPNKASLAGSGGTQVVTFTCTPGSLAAGTYSATVIFTLGTSTATVTVTFTVTGPPTISATLTSLSLEQTQGGTAKSTTTTLSNSGASGTYTSVITYTNGTGWLSINPGTSLLGTNATKTVTFTCTPGSLTPDTYTGYVVFTLGSSTVKVNVTFKVDPVSTGSFTASPASLTLSQVQSSAAVATTTTLSNTGASGTWTSAITYTNGTGWLAINPTTAAIAATTGTTTVTFTCTPGSLTPDTYTGYVVFTLGALTVKVNVTFNVTSTPPPSISISPPSMTFTDTVGVGGATSQSLTLTNPGGQNGAWTSVITYVSGTNWIALAPSKDVLNAGASEQVTVSMNDTGLKSGTYTAGITFSVGSSTAQVSVTLVMNPVVATSGTVQMTRADLLTQYQRIMATVVGPQLSILATTYYSNPTTGQIIYGELDALFPFETIGQLHVMKSITDVTAFLNAYAYVANVLSDKPIVYYRLGEKAS